MLYMRMLSTTCSFKDSHLQPTFVQQRLTFLSGASKEQNLDLHGFIKPYAGVGFITIYKQAMVDSRRYSKRVVDKLTAWLSQEIDQNHFPNFPYTRCDFTCNELMVANSILTSMQWCRIYVQRLISQLIIMWQRSILKFNQIATLFQRAL